MNNYNENEIIALLHDPDRQREAFERIVQRYSETLYWQIRRIVLSHDDANDILQNTFFKAWQNIEYFRGEAKMSTWLFRIAFNECLAFTNKKRASETGDFDMKDVCDRLCDKLIFRHPHVFGEVKADTADKVVENWEQLKMKEKDGNKTVLSGVPSALPSLIKAYRIQDKARNVGFDWEDRRDIWKKVKEEIAEFEAEVEQMDADKAEAEFGDVMFSLINAARLYKINPDNALERTNQKFIRRFNYLEEHTIKEGKNLKDMTLEEMDAIWDEAKKKGL